jgi:hypothetical protein
MLVLFNVHKSVCYKVTEHLYCGCIKSKFKFKFQASTVQLFYVLRIRAPLQMLIFFLKDLLRHYVSVPLLIEASVASASEVCTATIFIILIACKCIEQEKREAAFSDTIW